MPIKRGWHARTCFGMCLVFVNRINCPWFTRAPLLRSRGSTGRSKGSPLGKKTPKVCEGNIMTARVLILCLLASSKAVWWLLEQPRSSIMELHPTFQRVLRAVDVRRLFFDMNQFGGPTKKPTVLYSSPLSVHRLWGACLGHLHTHHKSSFKNWPWFPPISLGTVLV